MQLDAATAVGGRRRVDGAVNVLILAALNAHICDRVVGAVLNGVIEVGYVHRCCFLFVIIVLCSDLGNSDSFDI
jgi:hypothetical protein